MTKTLVGILGALCPHEFWDNMPVVNPRKMIWKQGPIHSFTKVELENMEKNEPNLLPPGLKYEFLNIDDDA